MKPARGVPATKSTLPAIDASNLKAYLLSACTGITCLIFQVVDLENTLRFGRKELLEADQWWRIVTGNLVHLGYPHLFLNLAGLLLITILLAHAMTARQWALTGFCSMLGVGFGLLLFDPQLVYYVGLSGTLYGLLLGGAIAEFRNHKLMACLIGAYTIGKIVWEQLYGAVDSSEAITGGTVIVNSHLYGMIAGGVTVLVIRGWEYRRNSAVG